MQRVPYGRCLFLFSLAQEVFRYWMGLNLTSGETKINWVYSRCFFLMSYMSMAATLRTRPLCACSSSEDHKSIDSGDADKLIFSNASALWIAPGRAFRYRLHTALTAWSASAWFRNWNLSNETCLRQQASSNWSRSCGRRWPPCDALSPFPLCS